MEVKIEIPIREYLKKFIAKNHCVDPFTLQSGKCHISTIFLEPIKKGYKKFELKKTTRINSSIEILFPDVVFREKRFHLDLDTIHLIDGKLRSLFESSFIDHMNISYDYRGGIFLGVEKFMQYYSITDDDITKEYLVKSFQRSKNPYQKKIKPVQGKQSTLFD